MDLRVSVRRAKAAVAVALGETASLLIRAAARAAFPGPAPRVPRSVAVHRSGTLGDIVTALPALSAVRRAFPMASLTVVSDAPPGRSGAREVLDGADWIDAVIGIEECRRRRFDVWVELPPLIQRPRWVLHSIVLGRRTGARWSCGWQWGTTRIFLQEQSEFRVFPNEIQRLLRPLARAGIRAEPVEFRLPIGAPHRETAARLLAPLGCDRRPLVAVAPGAGREINRWPVDRFASVASALAGEGAAVVILGAATETELGAAVAARLGTSGLDLTGQLSVLESAAVLERAQLVVCNDSGIQHLAAAVSTPVVAIFSRRDIPGKWDPYGPRNVLLRAHVPCHTCLLSECPNELLCLTAIEPSEVIEACRRILRGPHR